MAKEVGISTHRRARLTRQGQITVPKSVREALGARPGDDLGFIARGAVMLVELRPRRSVLDFVGLASKAVARIPGTAEELDALVERGMVDTASQL